MEKSGYATAFGDWMRDVEAGKVSKESTALGWALYNQAATSGDMKTAITILNKMVQHQRSAAQALQATRILKQLSPEGQLYQTVNSDDTLKNKSKKNTETETELLKHRKETHILCQLVAFKILVSQDNYYISNTEILILENDVGIIKNEEGEFLNLKGNRRINENIIAGIFFIVGLDESKNITSLSNEKLEKYTQRFWRIEKYTDAEVSKSFWDSFEKTIADMDI